MPEHRKAGWAAHQGAKPWIGYAVAVGGTALAALLRWVVGFWSGEVPPFITFYPVVIAAAVLGGTGPGMTATILGSLAANFFFIPPIGSLRILSPGQLASVGLFLVINVMISIMGGRLRAAYGQARLQAAALESAANAIVITDHKGVICWVNQAFERLTGYRAAEAVGKTPRVLKSGKHDPAFFKQMWETILAGQVWQGEVINKRKDDSLYHEEMTITPVRNSGSITHFIAVKRDVTARKQAEEGLREQALLAQLRADATQALQQPAGKRDLLQHVAALFVERLSAAFARVWTLDPTGQTLELQASAGLYTHLDGAHGRVPVGQLKIGRIAQERQSLFTNEVIGDPNIPEQDWARREGLVAFAGTPLLLEGRLIGVVALFARHALTPGAIETFEAIAGALAQALARKQAEEEVTTLNTRLATDLADMQRLHEVSTRFARQGGLRTLLDAILDAAIRIVGASKGNIQLVNSSGELGITAQRGFTPEFVEFFSHIHAGQVACGTAMQTKRCIIVEDITQSPLFLAAPRAMQLKLKAGVRALVCTPLLTRASDLVGVISVHFAAAHRPSDRDLRLLDLLARQAADFIERTQAEEVLRSAREELARANTDLEHKVQERTAKLRETIEELEGFSYSMVHDMRAPLRAMQQFSALAQESCSGCYQPEGLDYFRRIKTAANRLDQLITDALNYSKVMREELAVCPVDAAKLLRGILETYPNLQPPAEIRVEFDALVVQGNESGLTQVFSNLLGNAVKFVAPGVKPCVRVRAEPRNPASGEQGVRIWVEDNGIGIPKEAHEKIFKMFQRMHRAAEYPGTGIGLTIVRKAMERMGGRVGVESEPGKGSRFWIELAKGQKTEMLETALHPPGAGR